MNAYFKYHNELQNPMLIAKAPYIFKVDSCADGGSGGFIITIVNTSHSSSSAFSSFVPRPHCPFRDCRLWLFWQATTHADSGAFAIEWVCGYAIPMVRGAYQGALGFLENLCWRCSG